MVFTRATTRLALTIGLVAPIGMAMVDAAAPVAAATSDPTGTIEFLAPVGGPVDLAWRAGDDAVYVVEQGGRIVQLRGSEMTPVLDLGNRIAFGGEQGLLGLAFSPDGTHAFVNFTDPSGATVVAEVAVSEDGLAFDGDNLRTLITIEQPYGNHNGGDLAVGPDGMLYIGMGDGGSGGDPERRSLDMSTLLGKMLRIDPTPSADLGYTIPPDNPYVGVDGARGEIWSIGLRNPWRFSFDSETGDLWIADVGQGAVEEVSVAAATGGLDAGKGVNFGWSAFEGNDEFNSDQLGLAADHHPPIYTYGHDAGCSISGGVRVRGEAAGAFAGWFLFGDYCSGEVSALLPADDLASARVVALADVGESIAAVLTGPDGTVYVLAGNGVSVLTPG